jgi:endoglucanase
MKHRPELRRPTARRRLVAVTVLTLAVTGGTLGHQLADARQRSLSATQVTADATAAAATIGTLRDRHHRPSTGSTGGATSIGDAATSAAATSSTASTGTPTAPSTGSSATTTAGSSGTSTGAPGAAAAGTSTATSGAASAARSTPTTPTGTGSSGTPLAGVTLYGPNISAAQAAASGAFSAADTGLLSQLAQVPTAMWLGSWSGNVTQTVRDAVTAARASGAVPVLVAYNVPDTDCGGYSAGGAQSPAAYADWIRQVADGIGNARAVVVVEPDALAQLCGDPAQRYAMLGSAIHVLETNPGTFTYLDAGNPSWVPAADMAQRLRAAGIADADGFSLNVSNFQTTASNVAYGRALSAALGGAHFVIDTSRNGNGPGSDWCNPAGRAVGERPTTATGQAGVDAFLWVKRPGESDGTCNGGPAAGVFWPAYALGLVRAQ